MKTFDNQVVLITGASGNLGAAAARSFLKSGAHLALVDRSPERLQQAHSDIARSPEHLLAGGVDLGSEEAVAALLDTVVAKFGRIDVVVHTVGAWRGGKPVHETPLDDWTFLYDANVRTTLNVARAAAPQFIRQRHGKFITIGARAGFAGDAGSAAYSASKSAVLRLNESLSAELKQHGVNVNCVLPSTIDTPQNRKAMPSADHTTWVAPEAIADVILFLASDAARAVHGAAVPVYGLG